MWLRSTIVQAILTILLVSAPLGCTRQLLDFTVLTTKNIDVSGLKQGARVTGEACTTFFLVPLWGPDMTAAMDRALEKGHGNVLVDVVSKEKFWYFLVGGMTCAEVTETVAQTAS